METITPCIDNHHTPWNKGKLIGQKLPLKLKDIWAIRFRLQLEGRTRELAMFNWAIDSKLRACDLVSLKVEDIVHGGQVAKRAIVTQRKTRRPVQFELTEQTRESVSAWIADVQLGAQQYLFPSRIHGSPHVSTRQYARIVDRWVESVGLDPTAYGTHTMRRTKATLIYRRTKNIRAVQILLGHTKLESTVRLIRSAFPSHSEFRFPKGLIWHFNLSSHTRFRIPCFSGSRVATARSPADRAAPR